MRVDRERSDDVLDGSTRLTGTTRTFPVSEEFE
jgi:hypothetical protein